MLLKKSTIFLVSLSLLLSGCASTQSSISDNSTILEGSKSEQPQTTTDYNNESQENINASNSYTKSSVVNQNIIYNTILETEKPNNEKVYINYSFFLTTEDTVYAIKNYSDYSNVSENDYQGASETGYKSLVSFNKKTGKLLSEVKLFDINPNIYQSIPGGLSIDSNGNIMMFVQQSNYIEDTMNLSIKKYDTSLSLVEEQDVTNVLDEFDAMDSYAYYNNLALCIINQKIVAIDIETYDVAFEFDSEEGQWIDNIYVDGNGVPLVVVYGGSGPSIIEIDIQNQCFGKAYDISNVPLESSLFTGNKNDKFYVLGESGINALNYDAQTNDSMVREVTRVMNLGIIPYTIMKLEDNNDSFTLFVWDGNDSSLELIEIPKNIKDDRDPITLGGVYTNDNVKNVISKYNKNSDKYVIESVCTYNGLGESNKNFISEYKDILNKADSIPDILIIDSSLSNSYIKGLDIYADLYPLIAADDTISEADLAQNVIKTLETTNGELPYIPDGFSISCLMGKTDKIKDKEFTVQEILDYNSKDNCNLFPKDTTASSILIMGLNSGKFIDFQTGICNFNCDEFKNLLRIALTYPFEVVYDDNTFIEQAIKDEENAILNGQILFTDNRFFSFDDYRYPKAKFGNEDVSYTGLPLSPLTTTGSFFIDVKYAISKDSNHKEEALNIIEEIIRTNNGNFPIILSRADEILASELSESSNNPMEYSVTVGDNTYPLEKLTKENAEEFKSYVYSISTEAFNDKDIYEIIFEEFNNCYAGTLSIDNTMNNIQTRVQKLLDDNYHR